MSSYKNYYYKLTKDKQIVPATMLEACEQMNNLEARLVGRTTVNDLCISTVFLTIPHGSVKGKPLLFETLVFDKAGNEVAGNRYTNYEEALEGHNKFIDTYRKQSRGFFSRLLYILKQLMSS